MEQDHLVEVAEAQAEVLAEVAEVEAGWEAPVPGPGRVGTASVPAVEQLCPIRLALPATT